jgi:hypothetical protein
MQVKVAWYEDNSIMSTFCITRHHIPLIIMVSQSKTTRSRMIKSTNVYETRFENLKKSAYFYDQETEQRAVLKH